MKPIEYFPKRLYIAVLLFFCTFITFAMRINFSILIVPMVKLTTNENPTQSDFGPRYEWSTYDQASLFAAYATGYMLTHPPGRLISEKIGPRVGLFLTIFISSILTLLSPMAAETGYWFLWTVRFIIGFFMGPLFPCCEHLISKWAPNDEKKTFIETLRGSTLSTIITWPLCGYITENYSWMAAFYITGIVAIFFAILWVTIIRNSPAEDNWMSKEEKDYIHASIGENLPRIPDNPPYLKIITSMPFNALNFLHFSSMWGLVFVLNSSPTFVSNWLQFKLTQCGLVCALPNLARYFCACICSKFSHYVRRKNIMSVTVFRKSFCFFSHFLPGGLIFIVAIFGDDPWITMTLMTLSFSFNGCSVATNAENAHDLSPNFEVLLHDIMSILGSTPGLFSAFVVAYCTTHGDTTQAWDEIFKVGGYVYIVPGTFFLIFGSGKVQPWNEIKV